MFDFKIDIQKLLQQLTYNVKDPLLFNSGFFLFFFCIFLLGYQFLYKRKLTRVIYFTLFSLYFFYKACGFYFGFILLSAVVDFNLSNWIYTAKTKGRKNAILIFSICINLGLLFYFKYTNFFIEIINDLNVGQIKPLHLILPIGISFYTFENLSYTIDVYRGKFKPVTSFLDYCFFLSFFPKLVMGPIVRASDFIPQIRKDIFITKEDVARGMYLILGGLFKKVVISDYIYVNYVQYIFDDPSRHSGIECLLGVYGYAMVIYCDFSGYSDMAIGMAKWMGFTINENFDSPYQSSSITEFWRRWHISLSSWLKDYLYISLGGNRVGKFRQYFNLMITMLLGGLWHGASFNFIVWGGMHGLALAVDKMRISIVSKLPKSNFRLPKLTKVLGVIITFHFVCFCWIFFKASSFHDAGVIITQIFTNFDAAAFVPMLSAYRTVFAVMLLGYIIHFIPKSYQYFSEKVLVKISLVGRIAVLLVFIWIVIQVKQADQVMPIYLQF
ncbi:MAG: alginate O-acetyltransferase [Bacteroidetes bacterium RIFCSPLOWO2_12_FULL_35_15]|nr:MAG: alginate O-acetyltransferase [Bacteroidetes bacterium RIFCSPLOWO2_12_FULL_35_15]